MNWDKRMIWFMRCPKTCSIKHQNITFKTRRVQLMDNQDKNNRKLVRNQI